MFIHHKMNISQGRLLSIRSSDMNDDCKVTESGYCPLMMLFIMKITMSISTSENVVG